MSTGFSAAEDEAVSTSDQYINKNTIKKTVH